MLMFTSSHDCIVRSMQRQIDLLEIKMAEQGLSVITPISLEVSFDFKGKDAFSIEREKNSKKTVIGFLSQDSDGSLRDDYFYCDTTDEIHLRLVDEFNESLANRYMVKK